MSAAHNVVICGECRELVDRSGTFAWPGCRCDPRSCPGPDYSPGKAFLCKCCAGALLIDCHKWTIYFCASCRPHVAELNRAVGWPVITYGKRAIVNATFVDAGHQRADPAAAIWSTAVDVEQLDQWVARWVTDVLTRAGRADGGDVAVSDYFAHTPHGPDTSRQAFSRLCDFVGVTADLHSAP